MNNAEAPTQSVSRIVHTADAITWLTQQSVLSGCSLVVSLPDVSELKYSALDHWKEWFISAAKLVLSRTPPEGVAIFYQSDIRHQGVWVDKGFLVLKAAEAVGIELLWHKIGCRVPPGQANHNRAGYSHILCFSETVRPQVQASTPDVLPSIGQKTWVRGMGLWACLEIARFIKTQTLTETIVDPFCGQGGMLAAANACGLSAVGVERSTSRAEMARQLQVDIQAGRWVTGDFLVSAESDAKSPRPS